MQRTGMSERSVYRAVTEGRLHTAQRPIPGRKPLTIYDPTDVEKLESANQNGRTQVLPPLAAGPQQLAAFVPPQAFWGDLLSAVRTLAPPPLPVYDPADVKAIEQQVTDSLPSLAELRNKLVVTKAEAKRLGFTSKILSAVEELPGKRFKMRDLEAL